MQNASFAKRETNVLCLFSQATLTLCIQWYMMMIH